MGKFKVKKHLKTKSTSFYQSIALLINEIKLHLGKMERDQNSVLPYFDSAIAKTEMSILKACLDYLGDETFKGHKIANTAQLKKILRDKNFYHETTSSKVNFLVTKVLAIQEDSIQHRVKQIHGSSFESDKNKPVDLTSFESQDFHKPLISAQDKEFESIEMLISEIKEYIKTLEAYQTSKNFLVLFLFSSQKDLAILNQYLKYLSELMSDPVNKHANKTELQKLFKLNLSNPFFVLSTTAALGKKVLGIKQETVLSRINKIKTEESEEGYIYKEDGYLYFNKKDKDLDLNQKNLSPASVQSASSTAATLQPAGISSHLEQLVQEIQGQIKQIKEYQKCFFGFLYLFSHRDMTILNGCLGYLDKLTKLSVPKAADERIQVKTLINNTAKWDLFFPFSRVANLGKKVLAFQSESENEGAKLRKYKSPVPRGA